MPSWFSDFEIKNKVIRVKSTGVELPLNGEIIWEALSWLPFFFTERTRRLGSVFSRRKRLKIAYSPVVPRPWYLLPVLANRARMKRTGDFARADAVFYFEDQTVVEPPQVPAGSKKAFNFGCHDISKSKVGEVFKQVFGYDLAVDPRTYKGKIAVKSEINGAHDGYAAIAPLPPEHPYNPKLVYQRLIDNTVDDKWAEDMRCPITGGDIDIIFVKRRPLKSRFANLNSSVTLQSPDELLSTEERANIKKFAAAMGLDWGGMDILRNKEDGKIYIVDVNKTDMGPPIALSMKDKSKATAILTKQLLKLIQDGD